MLAGCSPRPTCWSRISGPGVLAEMGFSQARLDAINPRLVIGSVNGYGSTGPYVDRPSFDFIAQAMSGFMATTGEPDGAPMRAGAADHRSGRWPLLRLWHRQCLARA